jgi:putative ABC transport system permease protein
VSTVVVMVSLVEGFRINERDLFLRWGSNRVDFAPPKDETRRTRPLVNQDTAILSAECPALIRLSGLIYDSGVTVRHGGSEITAMVTACNPAYMDVADLVTVAGRTFTASEERARAMVCVLGAVAAEDLFANSAAVDDTITVMVEGRTFRLRVLGVLKGTGHLHDLDNVVYVPLSTAQSRILRCADYIDMMKGKTATLDDTEVARAQGLRAAQLHNIPLEVWTLKGQFEKDRRMFNNLDFLLGGIGVVILGVSGLGLMNLMLVSLAQRRWEVGLRKALGATDQDIVVQFIAEAGAVSLLGAVIALPLAVAGAYVGATYLSLPVHISPAVVAGTEVLVVAIGVVSGVVPARRAARLAPRETLREA